MASTAPLRTDGTTPSAALRLVGAPLPPARPARPADLAGLHALLDRCSPETLFRRFHGAVGTAVRRELERTSRPTARHRSWVVEADGALRGTATLAWGRDGVPEAAFLVEDAWFRRGVGRRLYQAIAREAQAAGVVAVTAYVQADNQRARRFLDAVGSEPVVVHLGGGDLGVHLPVRARGGPPSARVSDPSTTAPAAVAS